MSTQKAVDFLKGRLNKKLIASLEVCAHCGICKDSCHYYRASQDPVHTPAYKAEKLRKIYRRYFTPTGKLFPGLVGARDFDEEYARELKDIAFGSCTMCRRCTINCPMGIDTGLIVRTARAMLAAINMVPASLKAGVDLTIESGNNMGVTREEFLETIEWLEEQLQDEVGDSKAKIPVDKKGARVLYMTIPLEVKVYPLSFIALAKIFYAAGEDWTVSSKMFDATNLALFSGEDDLARLHAQRLRDATVELGVKVLAMTECGHGFRAMRWEAENWLGEKFPFEVRHVVELIHEYVTSGRIKLDPSRNTKPVTYHDPCNLARNGGIYKEPREILARAVSDFREMSPSGVENLCCGGGGGMLAMTDYAKSRIAAGKPKADQIMATQAKEVVAPCHNCMVQLQDLKKHYKMPVNITALSEIVANALVLPGEEKNN